MTGLKENPVELTMGIHLEKLGGDEDECRIQAKMDLMILFRKNGIKIGYSDEELDKIHEATEHILKLARHGCGGVSVKYDGRTIEVSPKPSADIAEVIRKNQFRQKDLSQK